jgi:hypothetical protein
MTMQPLSAARAGVWKTGMTATERQQFEDVAGGLLEELGYARHDAPDRT